MERFYRKKSGIQEQLAKEKKGLYLGQDILLEDLDWGDSLQDIHKLQVDGLSQSSSIVS